MKMSGEYFDRLPIFCPGNMTMLFLTMLKTEHNSEAEMSMYSIQPISIIIRSIARIRPLINIANSLCRKLRLHDRSKIQIPIMLSMISHNIGDDEQLNSHLSQSFLLFDFNSRR